MRVLVLCVLFTAALSAVGLGQSTGEHEVAVEVQPVITISGSNMQGTAATIQVIVGPALLNGGTWDFYGHATDALSYWSNTPGVFQVQAALADPLPEGIILLSLRSEEPLENLTWGVPITALCGSLPFPCSVDMTEPGVWQQFVRQCNSPGYQYGLDLQYMARVGWSAAAGSHLIKVLFRMVTM